MKYEVPYKRKYAAMIRYNNWVEHRFYHYLGAGILAGSAIVYLLLEKI